MIKIPQVKRKLVNLKCNQQIWTNFYKLNKTLGNNLSSRKLIVILDLIKSNQLIKIKLIDKAHRLIPNMHL